jgi:hypothetical protein
MTTTASATGRGGSLEGIVSADHTLLIIVGVIGGFCLGYVTAWRFARKLEHHDVVLADWDQHYDAQTPRQQPKFGRGA